MSKQSKITNLGTSKSGTETFIKERLTSVALALLIPYLLGFAVYLAGRDRDVVIAWVGSLYLAPPLAAFVIINAVHMRLGMQSIIEDYVHHTRQKLALLIANWLFCWSVALVCLFAIIRIVVLNG